MSTVVGTSRTVKSSELSRNPAEVFSAAEEGPVVITRRDGEALVLTRSSEVDHQRQGLELAAQVVAASLAPDDVPFVNRLRAPFPWMDFLSRVEQEAFAEELVGVARACAAVSRFDRLVIVLQAWRSTAEAKAADFTPDDQLSWLDEPGVVPDPRAE